MDAAKAWIVYCLATVEPPLQTYIGATVDADRRLRQHNGAIQGGAKYTSKRPNDWYRVCYVKGFGDSRRALSFEWHWKHFSRRSVKNRQHMSPLERRDAALKHTLAWAEQTGMLGLEVVFE
jgi:structure-specific endonuclease subunit SLX1